MAKYNDVIMADLVARNKRLNTAINELSELQRQGHKYIARELAALVDSIKIAAEAEGIDVTDWQGEERPLPESEGPPPEPAPAP